MKHSAEAIAQSSIYQELVQSRARFGWFLTFIVMAVYFGFIALVAFNKEWLARTIGSGVTTYSIPIGIGVILITILMTGLYVWRANAEFDALTDKIKKEFT